MRKFPHVYDSSLVLVSMEKNYCLLLQAPRSSSSAAGLKSVAGKGVNYRSSRILRKAPRLLILWAEKVVVGVSAGAAFSRFHYWALRALSGPGCWGRTCTHYCTLFPVVLPSATHAPTYSPTPPWPLTLGSSF